LPVIPDWAERQKSAVRDCFRPCNIREEGPARVALADAARRQPVEVIEIRCKTALSCVMRKTEPRRMTSDSTESGRGLRWLALAGLRPTRQRLVLAQLLVGDGRDRHVSAESLFEAARAAGEPVSLATVYNTLRSFCDAGLLQEIMVRDSKGYFDTRTDHHPHFYWEDTGDLTDAPAGSLGFARLPDPPAGTAIAKVDVVIRLRRG
jgi:Fur family iron response transcriptional regulator